MNACAVVLSNPVDFEVHIASQPQVGILHGWCVSPFFVLHKWKNYCFHWTSIGGSPRFNSKKLTASRYAFFEPEEIPTAVRVTLRRTSNAHS
jgi:hypothetical protein